VSLAWAAGWTEHGPRRSWLAPASGNVHIPVEEQIDLGGSRGLVIDQTRSSPCTVLRPSSMGRVTVTSIWSMGSDAIVHADNDARKVGAGKDGYRDGERQIDAHRNAGQDDER